MLVLSNAKIHTNNPKQPLADAIAIETQPGHRGRILALGSQAELEREFADRAAWQDMAGRTILPGLTDAHIHLQQYALALDYVDADTPTQAACIQRVRERAEHAETGSWIRGHGWRQNDWPEGFGTAALLDEVTPHHPVYLSTASLHAAWVNTAALKAAGIDAHTPDPPDGRIQRDAAGQATGILFEEAMELVKHAIPRPTQQAVQTAIRESQAALWALGLTGVHDFDRRESFLALQSLHADGALKLRVLKNLPVEMLEHIQAVGLRGGFGDEMLWLGGIKVFADGALGPRTAAMLEPYESEPDNRGMLFIDAEELFEIAQQAARAGFGMTVHAIGDRANHEVLNAYEQLRDFEKAAGLPARRHRIEHVQVLHPDDRARLAQLGVGASMQPIHATADMQAADTYWGRRTEFAYAWRTQLKAGAALAFGSDAPVETPNPFVGMHAAVTRQRVGGSPGPDGWIPQERIGLEATLAAYTSGPAHLAHREERLGRLAPGFLADLIVLERDPFDCPASELHTLKPSKTMLGGEWVWEGE